METNRKITAGLGISTQISIEDLSILNQAGYRSIINARPDSESPDQVANHELAQAAAALGLEYRFIPVVAGAISDDDVAAFGRALLEMPQPILGFCRSGTRIASLWALDQAGHDDVDHLIKTASTVNADISGLRPRLVARHDTASQAMSREISSYDVVIVGAGAAGCGAASSILKRQRDLKIAIIDPRKQHYYQAGWTMIGGGIFKPESTERPMQSVIPKGTIWIKAAVTGFAPERHQVSLDDGSMINYRALIVAPGLELNWAAIDGLTETLGKNGVTSNYQHGLASYTWTLVKNLKSGVALFTQPPMPIKCAGAPQKAMYLSADHWRRSGVLDNIKIEFHNNGAVLFGVKEFVPPLMEYVKRYKAELVFGSTLKAVDGPARIATFEDKMPDGSVKLVQKSFDMLHVVPPQCAPAFVAKSALANEAGWVAVDQQTLQHVKYPAVFSLGDVCSAPNAKTAAAVRKQAPVVAINLLAMLNGQPVRALYDGYGACPLTVERGKVVLAEFGYGGKLLPSFPLNPAVARRSSWFLKATLMPFIYWNMLLKGNELMVKPEFKAVEPETAPACDFETVSGR